MSGLFAMFSRSGPIVREALERGTEQIAHRGPDGQEYWIGPLKNIGLGRRHLKSSQGDSLHRAADSDPIHVILDGRLYGTEVTRKELADLGHPLHGASDEELITRLYQLHGARCVEHLRGEFAFVLWDEANGLLFAARDHVGARPLHYAEVGGTLYIASEAKALFAAGVPARWDQESFFQA